MVSIGDVVRAVVSEHRDELNRLNAFIHGGYQMMTTMMMLTKLLEQYLLFGSSNPCKYCLLQCCTFHFGMSFHDCSRNLDSQWLIMSTLMLFELLTFTCLLHVYFCSYQMFSLSDPRELGTFAGKERFLKIIEKFTLASLHCGNNYYEVKMNSNSSNS